MGKDGSLLHKKDQILRGFVIFLDALELGEISGTVWNRIATDCVKSFSDKKYTFVTFQDTVLLFVDIESLVSDNFNVQQNLLRLSNYFTIKQWYI